jgi:XisI protein
MDKINQYQQILCELLLKYASIKKSITPHVKAQMIADKENHHYQLVSVGWHNNKFMYTIAFHFDIIDGKIWIQQNNTDSMIADELLEKGVPASDIVLGFISEKVRGHTGFAIA